MTSLPEQAGQLLTIGFEGQECGAELRGLLREVRPGGVIFFQRNIATEEQFRLLIAQLREALGESRPFLAIDQEGGQVDRFRELLGPLPSALEAHQAELSFELGDLVGRELSAFGLNLDFAPVLDIATHASKKILGNRAAGETPQETDEFATAFLRGLIGWNILECGKHFPGLGAAQKDSHVGMPVIESSREQLWGRDLRPYLPSVRRLSMVMVAHAWYPQLERALAPESPSALQPTPASLSPNIIRTVLRGEIGHVGLVVCDDLEMGGVLEGRTIEEAAVAAVRAGCDVLLVCRTASLVSRVHAALVKEAERDSAFQELLAQAAQRIEFHKRSGPLLGGSDRINFADLNILRRDIQIYREEVRKRLARPSDAPDEEDSLEI